MTAAPLKDLTRLCIHTITTRPWPIEEAVRRYSAAGVGGITVWRQAIEGRDASESGRMIREHGLSVASLCRGGFFPAPTRKGLTDAMDENRRCIDQAAAIGAPMVVLVCGAVPGQPLAQSRAQIVDGLGAVLGHAGAAGVRLAIEPLHPMYADARSAINTIQQARVVCGQLKSLGLVSRSTSTMSGGMKTWSKKSPRVGERKRSLPSTSAIGRPRRPTY